MRGAHPLDPLAKRPDLLIAAKGVKSVFLGVAVVLEHLCDGLPGLPDFVFVDEVYILVVLGAVVVLELVKLILVRVYIFICFFLGRVDCKASHLEFGLPPP